MQCYLSPMHYCFVSGNPHVQTCPGDLASRFMCDAVAQSV
jgi:hypothetical protein